MVRTSERPSAGQPAEGLAYGISGELGVGITRLLRVDSEWPMVNIELDAAEAAKVVDILAHLAALILTACVTPLTSG